MESTAQAVARFLVDHRAPHEDSDGHPDPPVHPRHKFGEPSSSHSAGRQNSESHRKYLSLSLMVNSLRFGRIDVWITFAFSISLISMWVSMTAVHLYKICKIYFIVNKG